MTTVLELIDPWHSIRVLGASVLDHRAKKCGVSVFGASMRIGLDPTYQANFEML